MIGGGPAGAAVACTLAMAGQAVTLLERSTGPAHKVCGDFLSGGAVASLRALGVDALALGGEPVGRMRLIGGQRTAEGALPFRAVGLSRRAVDEALLERAASLGVTVHRGVSVRRLGDGGCVETSEGGGMPADAIFLATGKHELRGVKRPAPPTDLIGLKMYFAPDPRTLAAMRGAVEIVLFAGGYAGLQLVEEGRLTLCLLVRRPRFEQVGAGWERLLDALMAEQPHLASRLAGATPCLDRPLAVAGMPYGYVHRPAPLDGSRVYRVGDQAAVIPSLAGDGVAIALLSGKAAAHARLAGEDPASHHRLFRRRLRRPVGIAGAVHTACLSRFAGGTVALARAVPGAIGLLAGWTRSGSTAD